MYFRKRTMGMKKWVPVLLVPVLLVCAVGGVYAYLTAKTAEITNQFEPVEVTCQVEEQFDGNVKQDVRIRNTGDINAFIRATVVATWVDSNGKVLAKAPVEGTDYTVEWSDGQWHKGSDGYWYHAAAVPPNTTTGYLIKTLSPVTTQDGCRLQVQILATAIQADPSAVAEAAWGVDVSGYQMTAP